MGRSVVIRVDRDFAKMLETQREIAAQQGQQISLADLTRILLANSNIPKRASRSMELI